MKCKHIFIVVEWKNIMNYVGDGTSLRSYGCIAKEFICQKCGCLTDNIQKTLEESTKQDEN